MTLLPHGRANGHKVYWAHFLCKNINLKVDENGNPFIQDPRGTRQNQGDWTWLRSSYFLRWDKPFAPTLSDSKVTLIVFSPTHQLRMHLQELSSRPDWRQGLMDPFSLLVIVAENIFLDTSMTISKLLKVLSFTERVSKEGPCQVHKLTGAAGPSSSWRGA